MWFRRREPDLSDPAVRLIRERDGLTRLQKWTLIRITKRLREERRVSDEGGELGVLVHPDDPHRTAAGMFETGARLSDDEIREIFRRMDEIEDGTIPRDEGE